MTPGTPALSAVWDDALLAARLFAIDPPGTGGVLLRAAPGPVRSRWLELLPALLPAGAPLRRVPLNIADGRLLGELDLAATLRAGRPLAARGLLAEADGGVLLLAMAERVSAATAARLAAVLDAREVVTEREGLKLRTSARLGVVALDEGADDGERPPPALLDRLAFHLDLSALGMREVEACASAALDDLGAARARLPQVEAGEAAPQALCAVALALGIDSLRAVLLALRVARASAALGARRTLSDDDLALAGRLVLAPRATMLPAPDAAEPPAQPQPDASAQPAPRDRPLEDRVLDAVRAILPPDLLARMQTGPASRSRAQAPGRAGAQHQSGARGCVLGARAGQPRGGARLDLVGTLRAAAPWQPLRRREAARCSARRPRLEVRREDFRIARRKQRTGTTMIFAVDASGSAALHRLAEAKGAVELLLAQCYVRRDRVALIAFRGRGAELPLPPTRSLVRAKRSLAGLPGGGATPLAAGIDAAAELADAVRRKGDAPLVVMLTDGRANMTRDGEGGRGRAADEALQAARGLGAARLSALLIDTSPRPQPLAQRLAAEMGARYLPLPHADATGLCAAVRGAA
jgi:magnesium chelatase subunit D